MQKSVIIGLSAKKCHYWAECKKCVINGLSAKSKRLVDGLSSGTETYIRTPDIRVSKREVA